MQYGFYFDQTRCINCNACTVACKDWNDVKPGTVSLRKLHTSYEGEFPATKVFNTVYSCNHCKDPKCLPACPYTAITKRDDGIVVLDRNKCQGAGGCITACPYKAPQFADDKQEPIKKDSWNVAHPANKCNFCLDRLSKGLQPACVGACPQRAIEFGDIDELKNKHSGEYSTTVSYDFPDPSETTPSIIFKKR